MPKPDVSDHVVVGSGINSLVAAAMLAGKGDTVSLLEREDRLGGCMFTDEITLPGYKHDVMAATFVLFLTSPAFAELGDDLSRHGLEFCHTPHPTAVLRRDGSRLVFSMDRKANAASFDAICQGDGIRYLADMGELESNAEFLFSVLGGEIRSAKGWRGFAKEAFRRSVKGLSAWAGNSLVPARGWLETTYSSELVQALWAPWVLHAGLTPESTFSGQMGKVIAFALEAAGAPVARGGAGSAVRAFKSLITERGGKIFTGADVESVRVKRGRATGVETVCGKEFNASKSVICSLAPGQLYGRLLKGHSFNEHAMASAFRHGRGNFQLHYALDAHPEWKADGLRKVALIHLADSIDSVSKSSNEAERGMLPETPTICVGQPHSLDASRCPEGKAVLWVQVPDAPRIIKGDSAGQIETEAMWTAETKEAFADRIEMLLSDHIKDFRGIALARRAYSPADLESLNVNLVGGDPYGGSCTVDQSLFWRPFSNSSEATTPVRKLFHIGSSTHPGPGLSGGSGYNLAKRLGA
ncbi:MAG: NAD(P)/FAD-dependent oxidoreductase [Albidovulum sp.]|nr:NAD(P)/FAD-dependent oxidoreductase [Albidovulum sp.]MDE0531512.1 NAD(P)/FAD-dependent oxidoreductase [Albidovulum sp.]